jgi:hypothetical protein
MFARFAENYGIIKPYKQTNQVSRQSELFIFFVFMYQSSLLYIKVCLNLETTLNNSCEQLQTVLTLLVYYSIMI